MPPRKPPKPPAPTAPLPPPNTSHPCYAPLQSALANLPDRPHSPSYHLFFNLPLSASTTRQAVPPPKKKQKKVDELPRPIEGSWEAERIQEKLLKWFDAKRGERTMPWRKDGVPSEMTRKERSQRGYEVWVSEIMLQQTQVATCVNYYERWIAKFPTVKALSKASLDEVNSIWTGLGYYSRAKRLLEGAQTVVRDFDGYVPETVEELLTIEGIGPYSAGAISSIAFGKRSALVDGNVTRVLSRLTALHAPSTAKSTTSFIWALSDLLVPDNEQRPGAENDGIKNRPGSWNQGLMELGATVCTPKNPKCGECPISEECLGYQEARSIAHRSKSKLPGSADRNEVDLEDLCTLCSPLPSESSKSHAVEIYPMAKERKKQREEETAVCLVEWEPSGEANAQGKERKVLVMKRPEKGLLAGLLEFPSVDLPPTTTLSTPSARSKYLHKLVSSLLELSSDFNFSSSANQELEIESVKHVYSHIIRTYHTIHLVLRAPSLPKLRRSKSVGEVSATKKDKNKKKKRSESSEQEEGDEEDEEALVQSRVGTGKWIDSSLVEGESLGGAMKKVWELREEAVQGGGKGKSGKGGGSGKRKVNGKEKEKEKGQKSLVGFFEAKEKKVDLSEREEDDDVVVIMEKKEKVDVKRRKDDGDMIEEVKVEEKKVYKKRRIAPASDEEDED